MKIKDAKFTKAEFLKRFFEEHSDEVFTIPELRERLEFAPPSSITGLERRGEISSLSLGVHNTYYGSADAIKKLKQRVEKEWKSMK